MALVEIQFLDIGTFSYAVNPSLAAKINKAIKIVFVGGKKDVANFLVASFTFFKKTK
jgi:hypothetical protein